MNPLRMVTLQRMLVSRVLGRLPSTLSSPCTRLPLSSVIRGKHTEGGGWDLVSMVCLERRPVLTPALGGVQAAMVDLVTTRELERSLLSDHELKGRADLAREERKRSGEEVEEVEEGVTTALDLEDQWRREAATFQAAARSTGADQGEDTRSADRRLEQYLRLVAKVRLGEEEVWQLPWTARREGETMRAAAERALEEKCGAEVAAAAVVLGNAPCSHYKYKYPKPVAGKAGARGAKVFLYRGYLQHTVHSEPKVVVQAPVVDYTWATLGEMEGLVGRAALRAVLQMSMPED